MSSSKKSKQRRIQLTVDEKYVNLIKDFAEKLKQLKGDYPQVDNKVLFHTHAHQHYRILGVGYIT